MSDMSSPSAIDKTLMVLDAVLEHSRFTDVVTATGLAKSTVHRSGRHSTHPLLPGTGPTTMSGGVRSVRTVHRGPKQAT